MVIVGVQSIGKSALCQILIEDASILLVFFGFGVVLLEPIVF